MGLPTDDHLSRTEGAEAAELLIMWLSQMNACSCAMRYVSHRARRGHGDGTSYRRSMISMNDDAPQYAAARC